MLWVDGDATRLTQVFGNLLGNAAKYTPPGGRMEVRAGRVAAAEAPAMSSLPIVRVEVADNGAGIAAEVLPHVFEIFVQADHSLDRSQGGLGIGLSLVHNLVQLHSGSVRAQSAGSGEGSFFTVQLPLATAPQTVAAPKARAPAPSGAWPWQPLSAASPRRRMG